MKAVNKDNSEDNMRRYNEVLNRIAASDIEKKEEVLNIARIVGRALVDQGKVGSFEHFGWGELAYAELLQGFYYKNGGWIYYNFIGEKCRQIKCTYHGPFSKDELLEVLKLRLYIDVEIDWSIFPDEKFMSHYFSEEELFEQARKNHIVE